MKLSILIPTIKSREPLLNKLMIQLLAQIGMRKDIEVLTDDSEGTIGAKRNKLLNRAKGKYLCFIDDDDMISSTYIEETMNAISKSPDCVSLRGVITVDGLNPELFEHSLRYTAYSTTDKPIKYERYPNHLNAIKSSVAKRFKFPETNFGEDTDWATQIHESGLLKKEIYIEKILYHYQYVTKKSY